MRFVSFCHPILVNAQTCAFLQLDVVDRKRKGPKQPCNPAQRFRQNKEGKKDIVFRRATSRHRQKQRDDAGKQVKSKVNQIMALRRETLGRHVAGFYGPADQSCCQVLSLAGPGDPDNDQCNQCEMHGDGEASEDDADPRMSRTPDLRGGLALSQPRDPERDGDAAENEADNRNDAEHAQVIGRECMRILVGDDAAGGVTRRRRQWRRGCGVGGGHKIVCTPTMGRTVVELTHETARVWSHEEEERVVDRILIAYGI